MPKSFQKICVQPTCPWIMPQLANLLHSKKRRKVLRRLTHNGSGSIVGYYIEPYLAARGAIK